MSLQLQLKLASLVIHSQELRSPYGNEAFDGPAIDSILGDPEVEEFLDGFPPGMLPVKRHDR